MKNNYNTTCLLLINVIILHYEPPFDMTAVCRRILPELVCIMEPVLLQAPCLYEVISLNVLFLVYFSQKYVEFVSHIIETINISAISWLKNKTKYCPKMLKVDIKPIFVIYNKAIKRKLRGILSIRRQSE